MKVRKVLVALAVLSTVAPSMAQADSGKPEKAQAETKSEGKDKKSEDKKSDDKKRDEDKKAEDERKDKNRKENSGKARDEAKRKSKDWKKKETHDKGELERDKPVVVSETTTNGWKYTIAVVGKPVVGQPLRFVNTFERVGAGPSGRIYLETGWYWFTNYELTSCVAKNASCDQLTSTIDASATGVDNGILVQAATIPVGDGPSKIVVNFTAIPQADERCSFYGVAYNDDAANPFVIAPPAVKNFGCGAPALAAAAPAAAAANPAVAVAALPVAP